MASVDNIDDPISLWENLVTSNIYEILDLELRDQVYLSPLHINTQTPNLRTNLYTTTYLRFQLVGMGLINRQIDLCMDGWTILKWMNLYYIWIKLYVDGVVIHRWTE